MWYRQTLPRCAAVHLDITEVIMKQKPQLSIDCNQESSLPLTRCRGPHSWPWSAAPFLGAAVVTAALAGGYSPASAQTATANLNVSATVTKNCTIKTDPVAFGNYDALSAAAVDQQGAIKITCTKGTLTIVQLGNGANLQGAQRAMAGGSPAGFLNYELYSDSGRTTRWGSTGTEMP